MENIKQCRLCFSELDNNNNEWPEVCSRQKLFDSCDKYLHSALSRESLQTVWDDQTVSLCLKCLQSASTLVEFSEQMDFIQKSTSELAFIFSLEILHRRGKVGDKFGNKSRKQLIEFDVSALPNVDNWDVTSDLPIPSGSVLNCIQETIFESDCVEINPLTGSPLNSSRSTTDFDNENVLANGVEQNSGNTVVTSTQMPEIEGPLRSISTQQSINLIQRLISLPDADNSIVTFSVATSCGSILNGIQETISDDECIEIDPSTGVPVMNDNRTTSDIEMLKIELVKTEINISNDSDESEIEVIAEYSQRSISNVQRNEQTPLLMLQNSPDVKNWIVTSASTSPGSILNGIEETLSENECIEIDPLTVFPVMHDNIERPTTELYYTENHINNDNETEDMAENPQPSILNVQCNEKTPLLILHKLKFNGNGKNVLVSEMNINRSKEINDRNRNLTTVWTKNNPRSSYMQMCKRNLLDKGNKVQNPSNSAEIPTMSGIPFIRLENGTEDKEKPEDCTRKETVPRERRTGETESPQTNSRNGIVSDEQNAICSVSIHNAEVNPLSLTERTMFHCKTCKENFKSKHSLLRHKTSHRRSFKCNFCAKRFSKYTIMELHQRTHKGEKPFKCSMCPKGFTSLDGLSYHRRVMHFKIKPFKCPTCGNQYGHKSNLKIHMSMHTGEKPYKCNQCNYAAFQLGLLKTHKTDNHS